MEYSSTQLFKCACLKSGQHKSSHKQCSARCCVHSPTAWCCPCYSHHSVSLEKQTSLLPEAENHRVILKRLPRSSAPAINPALPYLPPLNHVPKCHHIYTSFKHLGRWHNCLPGQPYPVLDNPLFQVFFPSIQSKLTGEEKHGLLLLRAWGAVIKPMQVGAVLGRLPVMPVCRSSSWAAKDSKQSSVLGHSS